MNRSIRSTTVLAIVRDGNLVQANAAFSIMPYGDACRVMFGMTFK